ncbi:hypothetical protein DERF_001555 [Dermatophagoides farinae]|uniref:Uncharacterized protein n=1 Tax=Dermatophagoides farinae TaxID=6954 RepID=A0A922L8S4_DERFA|nr:hypothetical protein DERF_001555 [Dermatophagoides farinae]
MKLRNSFFALKNLPKTFHNENDFMGKLFSIYEFQSEALKTDDDHFLDGNPRYLSLTEASTGT